MPWPKNEEQQGFSRIMTRPASQVRSVKNYHGSSRVGSERFRNLTGRVWSGREVFKFHG